MINRTEQEIISRWKGNIDHPEVSIRCTTYNHHLYIEDALDSFLMQETSFPFEIVIHDDASIDNTKRIIEKYFKNYPRIIRPIFEIENQYSKGNGCLNKAIIKYFRGKYVAFCEGDDYWIDNLKLQKQYDSMENNKDCFLCVHNTEIHNSDGTISYLPIRRFNEGVIESSEFLNTMSAYNFHTSSFFFNKEKLLKYYSEDLAFIKAVKVGDIPLLLYFGYIGNIYYISNLMSVYRKNNKSSWTEKHIKNKDMYVNTAKNMIDMINKFDIYTNGKYKEMRDKFIKNWEFNIFFRTNNYKKLMSKEYDRKRSTLSLARRIVIHIGYYFPRIADFIINLHDRINDHK